jgi:hypothetical protein
VDGWQIEALKADKEEVRNYLGNAIKVGPPSVRSH